MIAMIAAIVDCLQSAFSFKIRLVLDLNFAKKNKRLLAVYCDR